MTDAQRYRWLRMQPQDAQGVKVRPVVRDRSPWRLVALLAAMAWGAYAVVVALVGA